MLKLILVFFTALYTTHADANNITSITLSPHLTELVFSAGAGDSLVGISAYSNFPEATKDIPQIGDAFRLDFELIKSLQPDIVLYWKNGTANQVLHQLKSMGFKLHEVNITQLSDIPQAIIEISQVLNSTPLTPPGNFNQRLNQLKSHATGVQKSVLIQISDKPIFTVNGKHWMSEAVAVCGLNNVFADLEPLSAAVTLESVILKSPDVIVTTSSTNHNPLKNWPKVPAIKNNSIIQIDPDKFTRPTLRLLDAIELLCKKLDSD